MKLGLVDKLQDEYLVKFEFQVIANIFLHKYKHFYLLTLTTPV